MADNGTQVRGMTYRVEYHRCVVCYQQVMIAIAPHPCGGEYVVDVLGECGNTTPPRYHTITLRATA